MKNKKDAVLGYKKMLTQDDAEQREDQSWIQVKRQQIYSTANTSQPQQVSKETSKATDRQDVDQEKKKKGIHRFFYTVSFTLFLLFESWVSLFLSLFSPF